VPSLAFVEMKALSRDRRYGRTGRGARHRSRHRPRRRGRRRGARRWIRRDCCRSWRRWRGRWHRVRPERSYLAAGVLLGSIDLDGGVLLRRIDFDDTGIATGSIGLGRIGLGRIGLGRIGLAGICRGSFSLGGIPRRIFLCGVTGGCRLGFPRFFDYGLASSALLLPDARFAVGSGLHRGLPICRPGGFGRRVRPRQPLRVSAWTRALASR
jgi:hypothetical protein